jgi:hypothetical protein
VPAVSIHHPAAIAAGSNCPSCRAAVGRGTVLCTRCGYNFATGQRLVAGRQSSLGKPQAGNVWYLTPYPYVGALVIVLATFYFLGKQNPVMMLGFVGVGVLYSLAIHLMVLVAAFREGAGTGFLSLCIPFYALYFVFKVHDNDTLKILYGVAVLLNITLRFLKPN